MLHRLVPFAIVAVLASDGCSQPDGVAEEATPTTTTTSLAATTTVDAFPHRGETVNLVEEFLDAFYAFDQEAMLATLAPRSPATDFVIYAQGWAKGAGFAVADRQACVFHEGGSAGYVTCEVSLQDDLMRALGVADQQVTDTYTVYSNDAGITLVEASSSGPSETEIEAGFMWIEETYPELFMHGGACWAIFNGGPTPEACAAAVVAGLEEYAGL